MTYDYKCDGCNTTHSVERGMAEAGYLVVYPCPTIQAIEKELMY